MADTGIRWNVKRGICGTMPVMAASSVGCNWHLIPTWLSYVLLALLAVFSGLLAAIER